MQQKTLLKIATLLAVVVAIIYGAMIAPPYFHMVGEQKERKVAATQDMKQYKMLLDMQTTRLKRTRDWAAAKHLSREETVNLLLAEARSSSEESNKCANSGYKIPMNPKALVDR